MPVRNNDYFGAAIICRICGQLYVDDWYMEGKCPNCGATKTAQVEEDK